MKIIQVYLNNSLRNFNYILYSEKTKDAIFFDPADLSKTLPYCEKLGLAPKYLINTHGHSDHTAHNKKFLKVDGTRHLNFQHLEEFNLSDTEKIVCLSTPGHVMEHYCFLLVENNKAIGIISGDTIFNAGIGNCKNGGNVDIYFETFKNLIVPLSDEILIYPSHDYFENNLNFAKSIDPENEYIDLYLNKVRSAADAGGFYISSIAEEKLYNPFFKIFQKYFSSDTSEKELFKKFRSLRDNW